MLWLRSSGDVRLCPQWSADIKQSAGMWPNLIGSNSSVHSAAVDLIHAPVGIAMSVGSWVKRQLDVRRRESEVLRRTVELDRKAAELALLERYDQERRMAQDHGTELAIVKPSFARWRSSTTMEFNVDIQIRNTWIYQP